MQPIEKLESEKIVAKNQIALQTVMNKLQLINKELSVREGRILIHNISGRIKELNSIKAKLRKKGCEENYETALEVINDIIGARAVCYYMDDLYLVADVLNTHKDMEIIKIKNYMEHPKKTGYRSLHLIVKLMIPYGGKQEMVKVEIQLRTFAMDYWAVLDHQLRYKKKNTDNDSEKIEKELMDYADSLESIDKKMMKLRNKIAKI